MNQQDEMVLTGSDPQAAGRHALALVSQYTNKYFWNEELGRLPEEIRKEVLVMLIMITEESGGLTVLGFEEDGEVYLESTCEEGDLGYDGISAGLLIHEMKAEHAELFEQLTKWYRMRSDGETV